MSTPLIVHICAGAIALIAGALAISVRKGGQNHRASGRVYVYSMLAMCGFGAYVAYITPNTITVLAACLTAYMVVSSWLCVKRRPNQIGNAEHALWLVPLAVAYSAIAHGMEAAASADGHIEGIKIGAEMYYFFAAFAVLALAGDLHLLWRGGRDGEFRIGRHLWRMCFALWIATTSFFEGQQAIFPQTVQDSGWLLIPGNLVLLAMFYFLLKPWAVKFYRSIRKQPSGPDSLEA